MSCLFRRVWFVALAISVICLLPGIDDVWGAIGDQSVASHKQVKSIRPMLDDRSVQLNTFAMSPQGELWLCCNNISDAPHEPGENLKPGCVLVYSVEGVLLRSMELEFIPQAINFSSNGSVFLAGDGKVARMTADGVVDQMIDAPNLLPEEELIAKLRAKNDAMIAQLLQGNETQVKRLQEQVAKLEEDLKGAGDSNADAKVDDRLKKRNETRLAVLKQQIDLQQEMFDQQKATYQEMLGGEVSIAQVARSTGIAVAANDIFVSVPSIEGQGYAVYRMTHDLTEPKLVVDNLSGCCGQLDIQSDGTHLIVAENSAFKVRYLDRDGADVCSFGERSGSAFGGSGAPSGWGSCCNPMNVRCVDDKEILVAESSIGHIKRYTPTGKFLGLVGTAKIAGGCKHVAIAKDADRDWYFMMNTAGNNIVVLVPLSEAPAETEDERDTRLAMEGHGQKLIGTWKAEANKADEDASVELGDNFDFGQYILDQNSFLRLDANGGVSRTEPAQKLELQSAEPQGFFATIAAAFTGGSQTISETTSDANYEEPAKWIAVRQDGDVVQFALIESEVKNYVAAVRFIDDDKAEFKWYYNEVSGEPMATSIYRKIADSTNGQPCDSATCKGETCDKPNCKHAKSNTPTTTAPAGATEYSVKE